MVLAHTFERPVSASAKVSGQDPIQCLRRKKLFIFQKNQTFERASRLIFSVKAVEQGRVQNTMQVRARVTAPREAKAVQEKEMLKRCRAFTTRLAKEKKRRAAELLRRQKEHDQRTSNSRNGCS